MTGKMPRLFAEHPPKKPLDNLAAIVDDWIYRFGKKGISREMRDEVVEFTAQAKTFPSAVKRACASLRPNGKMHNHQSRVPEKVRSKFADMIIADRNCRVARDFDDLYDSMLSLKCPGIGPVTLYDVATRIAAFRGFEVESLYLHAGVRIGWCLLHDKRSPPFLRIPRNQIPKELRRLPTDEIEDMLCAYREYLKPWLKAE